MFVSNSKMIREAPIGTASFFALAVVTMCSVPFRFLLQSVAASLERWVAAILIVVAYVLFSPAVAGALYSLLFERSKTPGLAALALATAAAAMVLILLDGLLLLPFWFLGIMGVVKFVRWRAKKIPANVPD
jgi:hypothetical protein